MLFANILKSIVRLLCRINLRMWQRSVGRNRYILPVEIQVSGGKLYPLVPGKVLKFLARGLFVLPDFAFATFSSLFPDEPPPRTIPHHSA